MGSELYISKRPWRTIAAVMDDGKCVELAVERPDRPLVAGNIYLGRVSRILPAVDGAFVELPGLRQGLLHAADVHPGCWARDCSAPAPPVGRILCPGQLLIVQPVREPPPGKGPRLTTRVSLPGRWVVFTPFSPRVAVSRRITDPSLRRSLASRLKSLAPPGGGFVVRTAAVAATGEMLEQEARELVAMWEEIAAVGRRATSPMVLWAQPPLALRWVREAPVGVERVVCDCAESVEELNPVVERMLPGARVELVQPEAGLMEAAGIMAQVRKALGRRIWLKSGGYIVLERTEAFTVVDVNTARNTTAHSHAQTILQTNLEAARTIAWALRLRNIGGVVVIDFVDMSCEEHKQQVLKELARALAADHAPVRIGGMSPLGLVELTRKRLGPPLDELLHQPCPACHGTGRVAADQSICEQLLEELMSLGPEARGKEVVVELSPTLAGLMEGPYRRWLAELEKAGGWQLKLLIRPQLPWGASRLHCNHQK